MLRGLFSPWWGCLLILSLLSACGGSEDEPSGFFSDTGGNPGGTPPTVTDEGPITISVSLSAQQLLPSGSSTVVELTTYKEDGSISPAVTMSITLVGGGAILGNDVPKASNHEGKARFTVSHPGSGNVVINVSGTGNYEGGFDFPLYFGATATAEVTEVTDTEVPANGLNYYEIIVLTRDVAGIPIPNIPVALSFPTNSSAVITEETELTNSLGQYTARITNLIPQTTKVIPIAGGMTAGSLILTFSAAEFVTEVSDLSLFIDRSSSFIANGEDRVQVIVIARDTTGTPIPYVPVNLSSDSATALLTIGEETNTLSINGNTSLEGRFELNVTDTVAEEVNLVAKTRSSNNDTVESEVVTIAFAEPQIEDPDVETKVAQIELDDPINNNQPANGEDIVSLRGRVLDEAGNPLEGETVNIIVSGGSAVIEKANDGQTDTSGRFSAILTDEVVEEFKVKAVIGNVSSEEVSVRFTSIPADPGEAPPTPPQSITLLATPSQQTIKGSTDTDADDTNAGQITLTAIVRDSNNTPMSGVEVNIAATGDTANTAIFDTGTAQTGEGGTATFKVSNSIVGKFTVTAQARGVTSNQVSVSFVTSTPDEVESPVAVLDVHLINNNKRANGEDAIQIDVVTKDINGMAVGGVPILVQMSAGTTAAVTNEPPITTGANGLAKIGITSSQAGDVAVTIAVEGTSLISQPQIITFVATQPEEGEVLPTKVNLEVRNNNQPANGESKITLIVTPRDAQGSPLGETDVGLTSTSENVSFCIDQSCSLNTIIGKTSRLGELRVTATSNEPETIPVTPIIVGTEIKGDPVEITFESTSRDAEELIVTILNNDELAGSETGIRIQAVVRDNRRLPIVGAPIIVQMPQGKAAIADPYSGITNQTGLFETKILSNEAGDIPVTITLEGTDKTQTVTARFKAKSAAEDVNIDEIEFKVENSPQPADGESEITLIATPRAQNTPVTGINVEFITDSDQIQIEPGMTNALGEYRATVTSTVPGNFNVTPVAWKEGEENAKFADQTASKPITFTSIGGEVAELIVTVNEETNNQLATGKEDNAVEINVIARNSRGLPVKDAPIIVQLLPGVAAVARPAQGKTLEDGTFLTKITSTTAGPVEITVGVAETNLSKRVTANFIAESAPAATLSTIEFVVENAPQSADGESFITLLITPRDMNKAPVADINIELVPDSNQITIAQPTGGKTNSLGEFRTTVTSEVAGLFKITPVAWKDGEEDNKFIANDTAQEVLFTPIGLKVSDLRVSVVDNNQKANGDDAVRIDVVARDEGGRTVGGVPIVVQMPTGTPAIPSESRGVTEDNGTFTTDITSTVAGEVHVTISIEGTDIAAAPVVVNFVAESGITPTTVELLAENAPQPADGESEITLIVIPRDDRNTPVSGVDVELIKDSNEIEFTGPETGTTNVLGEFRTTVKTATDMTDTLVEILSVDVTPVAAGRIIGEPTPVIFTPVTVPIPATLTLTVTNNNQPVDTEATLRVLARDESNSPMVGVPVRLVVSPGNEPPDVSGTAIFGQNGFEGKTGDNGVFETTLKNLQPGTVKVTATALGLGGEPLLNSNSVEVIVISAPDDAVKEVSSIRLITDSPQLKSEGTTEGVTITAIVKNKDNNPVEGALVTFSADSGEIQPIQPEGGSASPGMTDASGRAQARLTTIGDIDNRTITITGSVPTTTGEIRRDSITIEVTGTTLIVDGPQTTILGSTVDLSILLKNSADQGISGHTLTVTSSLGNLIDNPSPVTNASGRANIKLTANVAGQDTITVSKQRITAGQEATETVVSTDFTINISEDNFTLESSPSNVTEVSLNTPQEFVIHWDKAGTPQAFESINISATRGLLSTSNVVTDLNGEARFTISANNSGPAVITVTAVAAGGPSKQISIDFVARLADSIILRAEPTTIGVNTPDSQEQQSEIVAMVLDAENNLVKGKRVEFNLDDITSGSLSPSSAVTNSYGQARTVYTAGILPTAAEGVKVTATVTDTPTVTASVNLTVAAKSLFVTLGTGNQVEIDGSTRYKQPYTVLVSDVNSMGVADAEVTLRVIPLTYSKGFWYFFLPPEEGAEGQWIQEVTSTCDNEDGLSTKPQDRFNGVLDAGEDLNNNGKLEPSNIAAFEVPETTGEEEDASNVIKTVKTGANGYADFNIVYPKENALWVTVRITATTTVAGSETTDRNEFLLPGAASDYSSENVDPPGNPSPFGAGVQILTTEDVNGNGILDGDEDGSILENGILDTEDKNGNGILDPGEDGSIIGANGDIENPRVNELDTEDKNGNGIFDRGEDINQNGILDVTYVNTCNNTL